MRFTKLHGAGNDYLYVATFDQTVSDVPALARAMSDRHTGVGSDGLILICPSDKADVRMEMYNADGSRGRMCGNGIRCLIRYAYDHGLVPRSRTIQDESVRMLLRHLSARGPQCNIDIVRVETDAGILPAAVLLDGPDAGLICVDVGCPGLAPRDMPTTLPGDRIVEHPLDVGGQCFRVTCVSMGSRHAVTFVDDLDTVDLPRLGPLLAEHAVFPDRINAHFARVLSAEHVQALHWERGSGPTLACGTGACAICVAGVLTGRTGRDIEVSMPGGSLRIGWDANNHVYMTGPAVEVFTGDWPA